MVSSGPPVGKLLRILPGRAAATNCRRPIAMPLARGHSRPQPHEPGQVSHWLWRAEDEQASHRLETRWRKMLPRAATTSLHSAPADRHSRRRSASCASSTCAWYVGNAASASLKKFPSSGVLPATRGDSAFQLKRATLRERVWTFVQARPAGVRVSLQRRPELPRESAGAPRDGGAQCARSCPAVISRACCSAS